MRSTNVLELCTIMPDVHVALAELGINRLGMLFIFVLHDLHRPPF